MNRHLGKDIQMVWLPRWGSDKESACWGRRCGFNSWIREIPWRRKWQPILVFLPGKLHGQRSWQAIVQGHKELDTTEHSHTHMVYCYTIKCFPSLIIREMKFRTTVRHHLTPFRMVTPQTAREHVLTRAWREEEPCTLLTEI